MYDVRHCVGGHIERQIAIELYCIVSQGGIV